MIDGWRPRSANPRPATSSELLVDFDIPKCSLVATPFRTLDHAIPALAGHRSDSLRRREGARGSAEPGAWSAELVHRRSGGDRDSARGRSHAAAGVSRLAAAVFRWCLRGWKTVASGNQRRNSPDRILSRADLANARSAMPPGRNVDGEVRADSMSR